MALTREQKEAIAWCDFVAGLATAETGPVSFVIGAAASIAYYKDKVATEGWDKIIAPTPVLPSGSENQGVLHNLTCEQYLNSGYDGVQYGDMIAVAVQVKPDMAQAIEDIPEQYFNDNVEAAQAQTLETPAQQLQAISSHVTLSDADRNTLTVSLQQLDAGQDGDWDTNLETVINDVQNMRLAQGDKERLLASLEILKHSYTVWSY